MQMDDHELTGKIESFTQVYRDITGEQLDPRLIKHYLEDQLNSKKTKLISDAFSNLKIGEIKALLSLLEPKPIMKCAHDVDMKEKCTQCDAIHALVTKSKKHNNKGKK